MASTFEIHEALDGMGFETLGSVSVGNYRSYAMSLLNGDNGYCAVTVAVRLDSKDSEIAAALMEAFKQCKPRRVYGVRNKGASLILSARLDRETSVKQQLTEILEQIVSTLRKARVAPACTCAVCGGAGPESMALLNGYQPVHAGCVRRLVGRAEEEVENDRIHGSYLTGIMGAVLGMIVGMIPNLLTIVFLERIYSLLFALVPLASMWGYRKLGGKRTGASLAIVILLSFISVLLMSLLSTAFSLMREYHVGFGEAFAATAVYVFSAGGISALLRDSLISILYMGLGVWIAWRFLNHTNAGTVRNAQAAAASLRPNPNEAFADTAGVSVAGETADFNDM